MQGKQQDDQPTLSGTPSMTESPPTSSFLGIGATVHRAKSDEALFGLGLKRKSFKEEVRETKLSQLHSILNLAIADAAVSNDAEKAIGILSNLLSKEERPVFRCLALVAAAYCYWHAACAPPSATPPESDLDEDNGGGGGGDVTASKKPQQQRRIPKTPPPIELLFSGNPQNQNTTASSPDKLQQQQKGERQRSPRAISVSTPHECLEQALRNYPDSVVAWFSAGFLQGAEGWVNSPSSPYGEKKERRQSSTNASTASSNASSHGVSSKQRPGSGDAAAVSYFVYSSKRHTKRDCYLSALKFSLDDHQGYMMVEYELHVNLGLALQHDELLSNPRDAHEPLTRKNCFARAICAAHHQQRHQEQEQEQEQQQNLNFGVTANAEIRGVDAYLNLGATLEATDSYLIPETKRGISCSDCFAMAAHYAPDDFRPWLALSHLHFKNCYVPGKVVNWAGVEEPPIVVIGDEPHTLTSCIANAILTSPTPREDLWLMLLKFRVGTNVLIRTNWETANSRFRSSFRFTVREVEFSPRMIVSMLVSICPTNGAYWGYLGLLLYKASATHRIIFYQPARPGSASHSSTARSGGAGGGSSNPASLRTSISSLPGGGNAGAAPTTTPTTPQPPLTQTSSQVIGRGGSAGGGGSGFVDVTAMDCFRRALHYDSYNGLAWSEIGQRLGLEGSFRYRNHVYKQADCLVRLVECQRNNPTVDAWLSIGKLFSQKSSRLVLPDGFECDRVEWCVEILDMEPNNAEILYQIASELANSGRTVLLAGGGQLDARSALTRCLQSDPQFAPAWQRLCYGLAGEEIIQIGNATFDRFRIARRAVATDPKSEVGWMLLGAELMNKSNTKSSPEKDVNLTGVLPSIALSLAPPVAAFIERHQRQQQQQEQQSSAGSAPPSEGGADSVSSMSLSRVNPLGDHVVTVTPLECYQRALEINPRIVNGWVKLGETLIKAKRKAAARQRQQREQQQQQQQQQQKGKKGSSGRMTPPTLVSPQFVVDKAVFVHAKSYTILACFQRALELNPDNEAIQDMVDDAQREEKRESRGAQK